MEIQSSTRYVILKATVLHDPDANPDDVAQHICIGCDTEEVAIEKDESKVVTVINEWEWDKIKRIIQLI